jgi:hypothetical protein
VAKIEGHAPLTLSGINETDGAVVGKEFVGYKIGNTPRRLFIGCERGNGGRRSG